MCGFSGKLGKFVCTAGLCTSLERCLAGLKLTPGLQVKQLILPGYMTGGDQMRKRGEDKECSPIWEDIGRQPNIQSWWHNSGLQVYERAGWGGVKGLGWGVVGVGFSNAVSLN